MTNPTPTDATEDEATALARIVREFSADSGTIHFLGADSNLHLSAATPGMLENVLAIIGKRMAGLAVERRQPVNACNLQTDTSGDVRPGAKATGLAGSIVVPIFDGSAAVGALGVATLSTMTKLPGCSKRGAHLPCAIVKGTRLEFEKRRDHPSRWFANSLGRSRLVALALLSLNRPCQIRTCRETSFGWVRIADADEHLHMSAIEESARRVKKRFR